MIPRFFHKSANLQIFNLMSKGSDNGKGYVMAKIDFPLHTLDGNRFQLNVDLRLYAKESIVASAYKFSNKYHIFQESDKVNPNIVNVIFESKAGSKIGENDVKEFCTELLDQQLRYNTEKKFGHIRDLIVEEAFKPVSK